MTVLDTQTWLWWMHEPSRLSAKARAELTSAERRGDMVVSAISVWEIAVKNQLGKLELPLDINEWFRLASSFPSITIEPVQPDDAIASTLLPGKFHKDPADRIIVAVARRHEARLVTSDQLIRAYPHVECVW